MCLLFVNLGKSKESKGNPFCIVSFLLLCLHGFQSLQHGPLSPSDGSTRSPNSARHSACCASAMSSFSESACVCFGVERHAFCFPFYTSPGATRASQHALW